MLPILLQLSTLEAHVGRLSDTWVRIVHRGPSGCSPGQSVYVVASGDFLRFCRSSSTQRVQNSNPVSGEGPSGDSFEIDESIWETINPDAGYTLDQGVPCRGSGVYGVTGLGL